MSNAVRPIIVGCAVVAVTGCATIAGFEELEFVEPATDGGPDAVGTSDSSIDTDGTTPDGSTASDARRDAPIGCASGAHDFCDDFEDPIDIGDAGWSAALQSAPGSVARQNGELVVEIVGDSGAGGVQGLELVRPYGKKPSGARNDVSVKLRLFPEDCPISATVIRFLAGPANPRFYVDVSLRELDGVCAIKISGLDLLEDGGYTVADNLRIPVSTGEWHDVAFDAAQAQDGRVTASFRIDDGFPSTVTFASESTRDTTSTFVGLAPSFAQAGRVRIDDVRIDYLK